MAKKPADHTESAASKDVVTVEYHGNIREFSREIHGEDFMDVAKEFAKTNDGSIVE